MKNTNDFSKCKVGQKLWSIQLGECEVKNIGHVIRLENIKGDSICYTNNGKISSSDIYQSLYFSNPNIIAPEKPREKIPFDLEKALSGEYYLVNRDGREVQEWKWFEKADQDGASIVIISDNNMSLHDKKGKMMYIIDEFPTDLFLIEK